MSITIKADFTCDNNYAIWLGGKNEVHTLIKQAGNTNLTQILNGEHFTFQAEKKDYLYVIAWSDDYVKQGIIGTFNGGVMKQMGDPEWEVLPTGQDKDNGEFPTLVEINSHLPGAPNDWKKPFVGPINANTSTIYPGKPPLPGIDLNANWVWYDSNSSGEPFTVGFNHEEFLIFRIPIAQLSTCCSPCDDGRSKEEQILKEKALSKTFVIKGSENNRRRCSEPYSEKEACSSAEFPKIEPCFYLHWGDSTKDQMETHDDEVLYLTVCNPYSNLTFSGLTISKIKINPVATTLPNGEPDIAIIPNSLICFDHLDSCSCASRELTLLVRGAKAQAYTFEVEYCIDNISLKEYRKGKTTFEIDLVNS